MMPVLYSCPYIPAELIRACGLQAQKTGCGPMGERLSGTEGICLYVAAFLNELDSQADSYAAVFTTFCDQMRRAYDMYNPNRDKKAFLLNVPATTTENSIRLFAEELLRLERFLCSLNGFSLNSIEIGQRLALHRYTTTLPYSYSAERKLNLVLTGGPFYAGHYENLTRILGSAAQIVLDATESAAGNYRRQPDNAALLENHCLELARVYLETTPAIRTRPGNLFFEWFAKQLDKIHADGIIMLGHTFCDHWRGVEVELKKRFSLPTLAVEINGHRDFSASTISRLEAFLETIKK